MPNLDSTTEFRPCRQSTRSTTYVKLQCLVVLAWSTTVALLKATLELREWIWSIALGAAVVWTTAVIISMSAAIRLVEVNMEWQDFETVWTNAAPYMRAIALRAVTATVYRGSVLENRCALYDSDRYTIAAALLRQFELRQAWVAFNATRAAVHCDDYMQSMCITLGVQQQDAAVHALRESAMLKGIVRILDTAETSDTCREAALRLVLSLSSKASYDCNGSLGSALAKYLHTMGILKGIGEYYLQQVSYTG
jgi:hypothetical protein